MEFRDVVMKRRAVRHFEEAGSTGRHRGIAASPSGPVGRLQPGPATDRRGRPRARRRVAAIVGEEWYVEDGMDPGSRAARPSSSVRLGGGLPPPLPGGGQGRRRRHRDRLADPVLVVDVGATMMVIMLARSTPAWRRGSRASERRDRRAPGGARHPEEFVPIGSCRSGGRSRTSARRRSNGAGCASRSSPASSAGVAVRPAAARSCRGGAVGRARSGADRAWQAWLASRSTTARPRHRRTRCRHPRSDRPAPHASVVRREEVDDGVRPALDVGQQSDERARSQPRVDQ